VLREEELPGLSVRMGDIRLRQMLYIRLVDRHSNRRDSYITRRIVEVDTYGDAEHHLGFLLKRFHESSSLAPQHTSISSTLGFGPFAR